MSGADSEHGTDAHGAHGSPMRHRLTDVFIYGMIAFELLMIILFATVTEYQPYQEPSSNVSASNVEVEINRYYTHYTDVAVMVLSCSHVSTLLMVTLMCGAAGAVQIFVGFGFLMTYMHTHSYSAVGFTMLISAFAVQWTLLVMGFWERVVGHHSWSHNIVLGVPQLIDGMFGAGAVMITFGALVGKVGPGQLAVIAVIEIIVYGANFAIGYYLFHAVDVGGSMFIHTFGAYFGLSCSIFLSPGAREEASKSTYKAGVTALVNNDLFAMVGTLFLWLFWPSFNSALAPQSSQVRITVNTLLSLCGCCVSAFLFSRLFRTSHRKFDMVDIQNATLAGGVAVGSSADLVIGPGAAVGVGMIAGLVSAFGYSFIQPVLERKGLRDTCGVHNLHGMPGILGALAGIFACLQAQTQTTLYGVNFTDIFLRGQQQALYQFLALLVTLGLAISGGLLTGFLTRITLKLMPTDGIFSDAYFWETPRDYDESLVHPRASSDEALSSSPSTAKVGVELQKIDSDVAGARTSTSDDQANEPDATQ